MEFNKGELCELIGMVNLMYHDTNHNLNKKTMRARLNIGIKLSKELKKLGSVSNYSEEFLKLSEQLKWNSN